MSGCNLLFRRFFARWYPDGPPYTVVRGDMEVAPDLAGRSADELCTVAEGSRQEVRSRIETMVSAAASDWATHLSFERISSIDAVRRFDDYWSRARIAALIRRSDASDFSNDYLVLCCELGAVLGEVVRSERLDLEWLYDRPYWESCLWHPASASRLHVFAWAVKRLSSYGAEDGLRGKIFTALELLDADPESASRRQTGPGGRAAFSSP
ncbi:MAG: hypothetical protein U0166_06580 [Acidobacteriota bacterium]